MKSLPALALFAFVSPSIQAQEPALQADWFQSPTTGNWYGLDYSYRTWTDSEALSVSLGGHLATIRSQAEQDWMVTQFSVYGHAWYLGLNDEVTEGTFEWSSGEPVTFTAWAAGEPNNAGNEDYTEVKEDYTWQDLKDNHAGIGARPFIELPTTTKPEVGWSWPETFVTATGPGYGTLGDFDGDGDLDYASTYKSDNSLAIFWNDGQGSFIPGQVVVVPKNDPYMVVASDPDKDGDLDLVVSCRSDDLTGGLFTLTNRNGTFTLGATIGGSIPYHGIAIADWDGDGLEDLIATAVNCCDCVVFFPGVPGGGWGAEVPIDCTGGGHYNNPYYFDIGDVDGDRDPDLAVAYRDSAKVVIYLNDGSGGVIHTVELGTGGAPHQPRFLDLGGDGSLDLVIPASRDDHLEVWIGDGVGNFSQTLVLDAGDFPHYATVADFNGDGLKDVAVPSFSSDDVQIFYGNSQQNLVVGEIFSGNDGPISCTAGDLDGDGPTDLLVVRETATDFVVWLNNRQSDCNGNGVADSEDIANGTSADCDSNGVPDECQIADDPSLDCDWNSVLDTCDLAADPALDCDGDGVIDSCQIDADPSLDCDGNGILDSCDLLADPSLDCNGDNVLDSCQITWDPGLDCDGDLVLDSCQLFNDPSLDCDGDNVIDSCQIDADPSLDQNSNGILDSCECAVENYCLAAGNSSGQPAVMGATGSASLTANDLTLTVSSAPAFQFGLFLYGAEQDFFFVGDGAICVKPPLVRLKPVVLTDAAGAVSFALDLSSPPFSAGSHQVAAFETWHFQFWFRDPTGGPAGFNFSDGLAVTFCP